MFSGQTVIITGARRGLGRDYARYFAEAGANLVLADVRDCDDTAAAVAERGGRSIQVTTDVTDEASVAALVEAAVKAFGRIDVLINNAGLWRGLAEAGLLGCSREAWDAAWAVNVTGTWLCYKAVVPQMRAQGRGRIINISSIAASTGASAYGLTKHAVESMTRGMARETGRDGITVNCIAPGISAFEGAASALPAMEQIVAGLSIPRLGKSRDLWEAMAFLCSDAAGWVTGETLNVDGGALAR